MLADRYALVVVAATLCALAGAGSQGFQPSQPAASPQHPNDLTSLVDQNEVAFSLGQLRDRTIVMNFIFTHCAASCPLQLRALTAVQAALPRDLSRRVQFVSVTMDPERDTPFILKQYAARMGARLETWSFVTGHPREIAWLHQHFGAQVKRTSGDQFDHRVAVYLLDANGLFAQNYVGDLDQSRLVREIADVDSLYNRRDMRAHR
jgi:protein SCO1/2